MSVLVKCSHYVATTNVQLVLSLVWILDPSWPVRLQRAKALTLLFVYKFHISSFRERDAITKNRKLLQFLLTEKRKAFVFFSLSFSFYLINCIPLFIYFFVVIFLSIFIGTLQLPLRSDTVISSFLNSDISSMS